MWTRPATLTDLNYCLRADALIGFAVDRTNYFRTSIADDGCFLAGRADAPEGVLVCSQSFFSRPFISLLFVEEPARRVGLAQALMASAEQKYFGKDIFTSTNQSNVPMQRLLQGRDYLSAGVV